MPVQALPIDGYIEPIIAAVRRSRAVVVTAAPGAGKTTRVPPALLVDGPVILLQPRRVAARAIAARVAAERGWTLGREVGWQVRFERRFSAETALLVVTEGVLTARLQHDPLLSKFRTVVLDEFHERSVHADVALALARQAWRARSTAAASSSATSTDEDLRIVVMSATLDADAVASFLGDCPIVAVPGRTYPLDVTYTPGVPIGEAASSALAATGGQVLCFLPGAGEIRRAAADIEPRVGADVEVVPLHGSLDADAQGLALRPSSRRRIVVATNIAETSLTVPGVTAVVDTGLQKIARYDADRGIDSLETERVTADAADQRAGRAGRLAPGIVRRLWDRRDRLRPHREPDIRRIDLAGTVLDVIAWGGDPRTLDWFEAPPADAIAAALTLLGRLGVIDGRGRLTALGEQVRRIPLHPRLACMLAAAGGGPQMARACALLSERHLLPPRSASTTSDLLSALDHWSGMPPHVHHAAASIQSAFRSAISPQPSAIDRGEAVFRRAVLSGYPDRVAQRRAPGSPEVLLASGTGATIARDSGVHDGEFLVAVDVARRAAPATALVRIASRVEREWLAPTASETVHRFDGSSGRVRAFAIERYLALVLGEQPVAADVDVAARMLADAWLARGPRGADAQLLRRLRFAGHEADVAELIRTAAYGARSLDAVTPGAALTPAVLRDLDRDAPEMLAVPSGRSARLEYNEDGTVSASVKLQELFGLADSPRIGRRREPVVLALLAPNGRPVQITRDLRSFWNNTYPEVRKELRGRYPKHPWPEDPWSAQPTHRTVRRKH
ncbi:MAG TPA: ATP-dependent helicase C-terminal domain-containing protein [Vicinamibacterales bacterium]|nr:ATP-dependent helicase C-terminal domain-containing protein [Vicinamibacterales bacterium]